MPGLYWANCTWKVRMGVELLLLHHVCEVSAVFKVGAVEKA